MKTTLAMALAAFAFALTSPGAAQQSAGPAQQSAGAPPAAVEKPAPAAAPFVAKNSDAALQSARSLGAVGTDATAQNAVVAFLQREERNFEILLQRYLDASDVDLAATLGLELNEARATAALGMSAVRERRRTLGTGIAEIRRAGDQLGSLRKEWTRALEAERARGSPPALLERIAVLLATIDASRDDLRPRSQARLELDNRLVALENRYAQLSSRLDTALRHSQRQIFSLSEPPLWAVLSPADRAEVIGARVLRTEWTRASRIAQQFWQNYSDRVILQLILLAALIGAMASLSFSPAFRALEAQSGSVRVLKRPLSSALIITLFLSPFVYPGMPSAISAGVRLVSLVPVWRLIPTFVPQAWRALFYLVAALFGLETLFILLPEGTIVSRIVLLAMSSAALWVVTIGVRKPFADAAFAGWRWAGLVRAALRLASLLLVTAIVANLFGATRLAVLIDISIVAPAYLGIGLAAAVFVIEDFLRLLLHAKNMQGVRSIVLHRQQVLALCATLTRWLAAAFWLWLTLGVLGIERTIFGAFEKLLTTSTTLGSFELSLGGLLGFFLAVWIAVLTARFVSFILDNDVLPRMQLGRGVPATISTTARYLIVGVGVLLAASIAGVDLTRITLILGALSVGIGFGLQNIVNNFISGIILLFERPIQVGDTVQVGELLGVVRGIGIRASNLRTYGGAEVIVPNSELVSGQVINWTLSDRYRRLELDVGVAYGNRPADVIRILEAVVEKHEGALKFPQPFVRFRGFGASSLDFRLYVWADYDEGLSQTSAILSAVYDGLAEAGIEIPFPQRDLHLRSVSDAAGRALRNNKD